jgi:glutamate carboxypeptidase
VRLSYSPGVVTDQELSRLRSLVDASLPGFLDDLRRLVDVDCGSYTKAGVDVVGAWFAGQLTELGALVTIDANSELGDTVVAEFAGPAGPRALIIGHLDTVFPEGTAAARPMTIREGRAHGPGVSDMKGGLLAGLYALRALRALAAGGAAAGTGGAAMGAGDVATWLPFSRLVFIANPDEEIGSPVSRPVIRGEAERADVALVLEGARANGDIVSARKGVVDIVLTLTGRAAHAGIEPEKGRSAVLEAAHKTIALDALNGRWPGVTVNVGVLLGGTRPNVVAEAAQLEIDLRSTSRAEMEDAEAIIAAICGASTVPDVSCRMEERARHWPMEKTEGTAQLVERAINLAGRLGFKLRDAATGGASDANTTSGMGVPTLDGLGPIGGLDHSPDEYLEVDSIVPRTTLLAALLLDIAREGGIGATRGS